MNADEPGGNGRVHRRVAKARRTAEGTEIRESRFESSGRVHREVAEGARNGQTTKTPRHEDGRRWRGGKGNGGISRR